MPSLFIAGSDTNVGKTWVTAQLGRYIKSEVTSSVVTQKWIQTGIETGADDHQRHCEVMGICEEESAPYKKAMVPYRFVSSVSPHLAAEWEGREIDPARILTAFTALQKKFEWVLVEGSGGLMVPYSRKGTMCDILEVVKIPTLLVVENRVGAINQALLSLEALKQRRIPVVGVYLNRIQAIDEKIVKDNEEIIRQLTNIKVFHTEQWRQILAQFSV